MPRHICEDENEDYRRQAAEQRLVHPAMRRFRKPEKKCRACGFEPYDALTEDGLCRTCDAEVKRLEQGHIS